MSDTGGAGSRAGDVLVIVPAYNEADTIEEVVRRALVHADVCVVNDASKDRTGEIVDAIEGAHCIHHTKNTHIPGGVLDGMRYAVEHGYRAAITMDAGLSHNPDDIPGFVAASADADVVLSWRQAKFDTPWWRHALSTAGNRLYNYALDPSRIVWPRAKFRDVTSGYRLYSRRSMELLLSKQLQCRTFDFHIEAIMYPYRNGHRFAEIPIHYHFTGSSLNSKVVRDALRMLGLMIFTRKR